MRALFGDRWIEGLPDFHRQPDQVRIEVLAARPLERLEGLYPVRDRRDLRMVWNYARAIGVRDTLRKVASRVGERFRNEKYVSCGLGRVLESAGCDSLPVGQTVVYLCPVGPACAERLVLPEILLLAIEAERLPHRRSGVLLHREALPEEGTPCWWKSLRGWNPESGRRLARGSVEVVLKEAQGLLLGTDWAQARELPQGDGPVQSLVPGTARRSGRGPASRSDVPASRRKRAVLFGYGNYAKTIILPRVGRHLSVETIHELDPTQIPLRRKGETAWSTAPVLLPGERPDAVLVAGYHHTHAEIACQALRRGAAAVVEKPLATTRRQLGELTAALGETGGALYSGYQRRYLPFNGWVRSDLGLGPDDPISYHVIAYEVPLADLHWYRWPSSRSRLLSNGCHWLDHFLHLNGYAAATDLSVRVGADGAMNCSVSLENGAFFSMVLTDQGSRRLGVQDHVELRAGGATARIVDACAYQAEDRHRILRRARIARLAPYRIMYDTIGRRIAAGEPGDSLLSLQRSAGLVLDLEAQLHRTDGDADVAFSPERLLDASPAPPAFLRSSVVATAA